jgi:KAP family P-loop domain
MATKAEPPEAASSKRRTPASAPRADRAAQFGDMAEPSPPRVQQAPSPPVRGDRPQTWEEKFLAIVNNAAKGAGARRVARPGPVRDRGFLVVTHGSASLQRVQALCHGSDQRYNTCLTARYTVHAPVLGNLLAALVSDLARLASAPGAGAPVGELMPATVGLSTPPWMTLRSGPWAELARQAGLDGDEGELPAGWVAQLFEALGRSSLLPTGVRLVLFAEVEGETGPQDWARILTDAAALPERVGLVLSGAPDRIGIPPDLTWDPDAVGPTGPCLQLDVEPVPRTRAIKYVDAPLTGDTPAGSDALDRRRYAQGLARLVLLRGTGPLTIGVHAPWGRGKTSFMHFVEWELLRTAATDRTAVESRERFDAAETELADLTRTADQRGTAQDAFEEHLAKLRHRVRGKVIPVWFNAWRYEGATQIWAGLTHEITEQIEHSLPWYRRLWARIVYAVRNQGAVFWLRTVAPTLAALLLTALVLGLGLEARRTGLGDELPDWLGWLLTVAPSTTLLAVGGYLIWRFSRVVRPVSERLLDYVRQPNYQEHMGYQHQVLRDIEFLMSRLGPVKHRPRVVVFIDDLDRCSDEKVLETLQAINLLLTASGCYVFLGIDTQMIAQAVTRKYELAQHDSARAESYLRKIIQLSFQLPATEYDQRLTLLAQLFSHQARLEYATLVGRAWSSSVRPAFVASAAPSPGRVGAPPGVHAWSSRGVSKPAVFEIADVEDTVEELDAFARLRDVVPDNPRELKRLANLHRLVKILVQRPEAPPTATAQRLLVAWVVFCFLHGEVAEKLLREARAAKAVVEVHEPELDALIQQLNRDRTGDPVPVLTTAQVAPGTPLAEAAAISAHVQERTAGAVRSADSGAADGR